MERLERTVATLLDRLGEGPSENLEHGLNRPQSALTTPETIDGAYQHEESSAAPVMVIRDLATESVIKPVSDTRSLGGILDDLISPELSLTLLSMYVLLLKPIALFQFSK